MPNQMHIGNSVLNERSHSADILQEKEVNKIFRIFDNTSIFVLPYEIFPYFSRK